MKKDETSKNESSNTLSNDIISKDKYGIKYNNWYSLQKAIEKSARDFKVKIGRPPNSSEILDIVISNLSIVREEFDYDGDVANVCYIYNPQSKIYEFDDGKSMKRLLRYACRGGSVNNYKVAIESALYEWNIIITDPTEFYEINLPPNWIVLFENGYVDLKSKKYYPLDYEGFKDYHFVRKIYHNYVPVKDLNKVSNEIVDTIMSDWSNNNEDNLNFLYQLVSTTIEGDGKQKCIVIISDGGTGKSSFLNLIELVVGTRQTLQMNLHEISNDNTLNKLKRSTKWIKGDDLKTNFTFSGIILPRFKTAITGGTFMVSKKYSDDIPIKGGCVWIQLSNTNLKTGENSRALSDRIIYYDWCSHNFRKNNPHNFNLSNILNGVDTHLTESVIESLISKTIDKVGWVDKYEPPKEMLDKSQEMFDKSDKIKLFIDFIKDQGILEHVEIPNSLIYQYYVRWHRLYFNSSTEMSSLEFNRRFKTDIQKLGYEISSNARLLKRFKTSEFNSLDYGEVYTQLLRDDKRTKYYENVNNVISDEDVKKFNELYENGQLTSDMLYENHRLRFILNHLSKSKPDEYRNLLSEFAEIFEN